MATDGITSRLQKEMGQLQQELSQLQVDIDAKFDTRLKEFQERFKGDMRSELYSMLEQFLDQHSIGALVISIRVKGRKYSVNLLLDFLFVTLLYYLLRQTSILYALLRVAVFGAQDFEVSL
ncbi:hypothetical protein ES332_A10G199000v1 [Gossypium tomentosum]|uniref:Uncharacterized protein n=1 Tax=Gossypium tomentosum TaxID=34277 RepID=A0A5D2NS66_GOSTO|nr:hypothetical protein ES332_A10G199000v1 [Gossypium tomentosum]